MPMVMIETNETVENSDEVLSVVGLDAIVKDEEE
jgi:2-keto-3-deoxy-L-rhamnonate aldolase RhmA